MGLSVSLANALTGMLTSQSGLEVLSRNVANAGTPGYHKQSLTIDERFTGVSSYVREAGVERAFTAALEAQAQTETGRMGYADVRADFLSRLELYLGMPGDANSIDMRLADFQSALQALTTSPDDYATRAQVLAQAQGMAETLNSLSTNVQTMRREAEGQIADAVGNLNQSLSSLERINGQLADTTRDGGSRAALMDERDRLVTSISELIDVRAQYGGDGRVALFTRSGIGLIDEKASQFVFSSGGNLSPNSLYSPDDAANGVGTLALRTPAGFEIDLIDNRVLNSGRLAALVELRDDTLVAAQGQLDEIAAGLALAMSTVETDGTAVSSGGADGFEVDLAALQAGNDFVVSYTEGGTDKIVRVVRVDDPAKLPMDQTGSDGVRTIGLDFSGGIGAVAAALDAALGAAVTVSNPAGTTIRILDDGAAGTTDITSLVGRATATGTQGEGLGVSLFVDSDGSAFTDSLDGATQKLGFASRIRINSAVASDNTLLVKYATDTPLGESARPDYLADRLASLSFQASEASGFTQGNFVLSGTVRQFVEQMFNHQGNAIAAAKQSYDAQSSTMEALAQRAERDHGVNIDEEMARLIELQNAYAANARVVSIARDLIEQLMSI